MQETHVAKTLSGSLEEVERQVSRDATERDRERKEASDEIKACKDKLENSNTRVKNLESNCTRLQGELDEARHDNEVREIKFVDVD